MVESPSTSASPHAQLLSAFAALKKKNDSFLAFSNLQKKDKDALVSELDAAKEALALETEKVNDLEVQIIAKSQVESRNSYSSKDEDKDKDKDDKENDNLLGYALRKNKELSGKILDLEFFIEESKEEKESLLKKTAALARRDQLQSASVKASNQEIAKMMEIMKDFQDRFSSIATLVVEKEVIENVNGTVRARVKDYDSKAVQNKDTFSLVDELESLSSSSSSSSSSNNNDNNNNAVEHENEKAKWIVEKNETNQRITNLETLCDEIQTREQDIKSNFIQTLAKHQSEWQLEREELTQKIEALISEKENIEAQVEEIAELLEKENNDAEHIDGKDDIDIGIDEAVTEDTEETVDEQDIIEKRDPPVMTQ